MPAFDLLSEPWIPVLDSRTDASGSPGVDLRSSPGAPLALRRVGLREALLRAHEIREVAGGSPLESIALDRLLLALALDVYQPTPNAATWTALWRAGRLHAGPLDAYLDRHEDRFDLLHPDYPFYQSATPDASQAGKPPTPLARLAHDRASGNNATLFAHDVDARPDALPLDAAARALVAAQAAALGGGVSQPFNFSHGALVGRAQFWIRGRSLAEALLLNGPPDADTRMGDLGRDAPLWRRPAAPHARRAHLGLLDALTVPARRVTLATETRGGETVATGVWLTQGDKIEPQPTDDPLAAHLKSDAAGVYPLGLRAGRALWRDAAALFRAADADGAAPPRTFAWIAGRALYEASDDAAALQQTFRQTGVDAFGLVNDQAKPELWRHERLPLHVALLRDEAKQQAVAAALHRANEQMTDKKHGLRRAVRVTADYALAPPAPGDDAYPASDPKATTLLAQSLAAEPRYWTALDTPFLTFLAALAAAPDEAACSRAAAVWNDAVFAAARDAFDAATASFDGDARHLRATAEGRARLRAVAPAAASGTAPDAEPPIPDPLPTLPLFL